MRKYVLHRILQLIPAILIVSFVVFWLMSLAGDPASVKAGLDASPEEIAELRERMGLNRPLIVRYGEYMWNLLHGDMGKDLMGTPVWPKYTERFPYTLMLIGYSLLLSTPLAITMGITAALHKDTFLDNFLTVLCLFLASMPTFWMSLMFQLLFAVRLGWLPTSGINKGVFLGLIMPGTISALHSMASKLRQTRSSMLDNLNADYVSTAQAKGVKRHDIIWKHCLRNALLPIITVIGSAMTLGIGGSVVLETIFAWPGLGTITVPAIRGADYMTACGMILMMTILVGVMNLLVDLAYAFADPRVKARYSRM